MVETSDDMIIGTPLLGQESTTLGPVILTPRSDQTTIAIFGSTSLNDDLTPTRNGVVSWTETPAREQPSPQAQAPATADHVTGFRVLSNIASRNVVNVERPQNTATASTWNTPNASSPQDPLASNSFMANADVEMDTPDGALDMTICKAPDAQTGNDSSLLRQVPNFPSNSSVTPPCQPFQAPRGLVMSTPSGQLSHGLHNNTTFVPSAFPMPEWDEPAVQPTQAQLAHVREELRECKERGIKLDVENGALKAQLVWFKEVQEQQKGKNQTHEARIAVLQSKLSDLELRNKVLQEILNISPSSLATGSTTSQGIKRSHDAMEMVSTGTSIGPLSNQDEGNGRPLKRKNVDRTPCMICGAFWHGSTRCKPSQLPPDFPFKLFVTYNKETKKWTDANGISYCKHFNSKRLCNRSQDRCKDRHACSMCGDWKHNVVHCHQLKAVLEYWDKNRFELAAFPSY